MSTVNQHTKLSIGSSGIEKFACFPYVYVGSFRLPPKCMNLNHSPGGLQPRSAQMSGKNKDNC